MARFGRPGVERIFDAAQYPSIVHEAARSGASEEN